MILANPDQSSPAINYSPQSLTRPADASSFFEKAMVAYKLQIKEKQENNLKGAVIHERRKSKYLNSAILCNGGNIAVRFTDNPFVVAVCLGNRSLTLPWSRLTLDALRVSLTEHQQRIAVAIGLLGQVAVQIQRKSDSPDIALFLDSLQNVQGAEHSFVNRCRKLITAYSANQELPNGAMKLDFRMIAKRLVRKAMQA